MQSAEDLMLARIVHKNIISTVETLNLCIPGKFITIDGFLQKISGVIMLTPPKPHPFYLVTPQTNPLPSTSLVHYKGKLW